MVIQVYAPTTNAEEAEVDRYYKDLQGLLELTPNKDILFIIGDWNAKLGSQEIPGITGKFSPEVQNEGGQSLREFCQENTLVIKKTPFSNNTGDDLTHGHHQMVNTKIRLIMFFAAEDGAGLHGKQKQDLELTVAQIMNSSLRKSGLK